jgi:hypothetical protein
VSTPLPVAAAIAQRRGYGGHAFAFLQYLLGLRQLGYRPILIDRLTAEMATDAGGRPSAVERDAAIAWFAHVVQYAGLQDSYALLLDDGETIGMTRRELICAIKAAPCLIDVMGFLADDELLAAAQTRVFLDVDPGFPQLWRQLGQADLFGAHDRHVTLGANIGRPGCGIPDCGVDWIATRPPIVLDRCGAPPSSPPPRAPVAAVARRAPISSCAPSMPRAPFTFTSVGTWRGPYDPVEHDGRTLGLRVHEFRKFASLPRQVEACFRLALDIDPADHRDADLLRENGWQLQEPRTLAGTPEAYRRFIADSAAEIAIAKNMYVATDSGWFSDRSACFLASGRPVLCQDTGFGEPLPRDEGIVAFASLEQAAEGARRITGEWRAHARAAREIAAELFDSRKVLGELLTKICAQ